jgi:hypothetical protein
VARSSIPDKTRFAAATTSLCEHDRVAHHADLRSAVLCISAYSLATHTAGGTAVIAEWHGRATDHPPSLCIRCTCVAGAHALVWATPSEYPSAEVETDAQVATGSQRYDSHRWLRCQPLFLVTVQLRVLQMCGDRGAMV